MNNGKGKPEWLNNPEFSRAIIGMSGLKMKPEKEDRGVWVSLRSKWTGENFDFPIRAMIDAGPVELRWTPESRRMYLLSFERMANEFRQYRMPEHVTGVTAFISEPDRKLYIFGLFFPESQETIYQFTVPWEVVIPADGPLSGSHFDKIKEDYLQSMRDLDHSLRVLRGWGYA